jgi:ATP-binding cassette subfamily B protein
LALLGLTAKAFLERRLVLWRQRRELLELLPSAGRVPVALYVVVLLAGTAQPVLVAATTGLLVSRVPSAAAHGLDSPPGQRALQALALLAAVLAAQLLLQPARNLLRVFIARRINAHVLNRLALATTAPIGIAHLEDRAVLDDISLAAQPVGVGVVAILELGSMYLTGIGAVAYLARYSLWLALFLACFVLAQRSYWRSKGLQLHEAIRSSQGMFRRAEYFVRLVLTPTSAKEARIFGLDEWFVDRYHRHSLTALQPRWDWLDNFVRSFRWSMPLRSVGFAVPYMVLAHAAATGGLDLGGFTACVQATMIALSAAGTRLEDVQVEVLGPAYPAAKTVEARAKAEASATSTGRSAEGLPRHAIRFEGVSFGYPGRGQKVFDNLDLVIPAGCSLAIVGANGAGKTTLVKLLSRLYEPDSGRITVDGTNLTDLSVVSWRRQMAVVFQDFLHYRLSAADNVRLSAPEQPANPATLRAAADGAGVLELIEALPKGWDTVLSREFTDGVDLSGGQWQRLALARALYAVQAGALVLALDEPTANLDVRAEARFFEEFLELTSGLTSIIVSHRFSTVRRADRICVVDQGQVVEIGSHDELLAAEGRYARLFRLQAARFNADADTVVGEQFDG